MIKTKLIATLATVMIGSTGVVAHAMPSNTSKASIVQNNEFGVTQGQTINFDGVCSHQHFQFAQDLYPNFQSQMYTASNGEVAYCLDNGLFGANGDTNYQNTNKTVSPEVHYILSEGYDGTQASIQKFTNWEGYGFNAQQAYEITQLAIWASNDANPACRVDLSQLYYTNITGKAIIQASQKLFNQAQNASNTLTIEGSISNITYNGGYQYIGPFKINAGEPISSYKVNLSGSAQAVAVSSIGGQAQDSFKNGESFYIKVTPSNEITHVNLNVTAKSTLHDAVIQSTYRNYYQNYANGESGYVNLVNSEGFDVPVPHALIVHRAKPAPKPVIPVAKPVTPKENITNNNVNKPNNQNEQHQSQSQTVNNKPVTKNTNTASPKDTNKDEQHQSTNVNNHPTNTNTNNITASPNQSNKDTFSPIIKINIYNDNNNSNNNANGNGSKATGNSNANSNANSNGNSSANAKSDAGNKNGNDTKATGNSNANSNGNSSAKADSIAKGGNANANSNSNANDSDTKTAKAGADSSSVKTTPVKSDTTQAQATATGTKAKVETSVNGVKKEVVGNNVQATQGTNGQSVSANGLPHTGLTAGENPLKSAEIALGTAGVLASILGVFGIRKLFKK